MSAEGVPDLETPRRLAIKVRRWGNTLATAAEKAIIRHRNALSCGVSNAASVRSLAISHRLAVEENRGRPPCLVNLQIRVAHARLRRLRRMTQRRPASPFRLCPLSVRLMQHGQRAEGAPQPGFMYDYRRWAGQLHAYKQRRIPVPPSLCWRIASHNNKICL